MLIYILFVILLLGSAIPFVWKNTSDAIFRFVGLICAFISTAIIALISLPVFLGIVDPWHTSLWSMTQFSALMSLLIAFVYLGAMIVSFHYLEVEIKKEIITARQVRLYTISVPLFVLSMLAAVFTNSTGIMWIALEATTLSTTLLVAFYRKKSSMEAAWKYIVLCSTGIALGLFGVLMLSFAGAQAGLHESEAFNLLRLQESAALLNKEIVKWAFVFMFIGFGTKIGFVPLHTWLPDAHSKTPAPVSGMLSGILLNVAFFILLRFKIITDTTLESSQWTNTLFLIAGFVTILVPSIILLIQHNYKRMLAYSSVEHMGLMAFLIGLGPLGILPFTIHLIGHTLAKSALFYGAGEILQRFESTKFHLVHDVMRRAPKIGTLFLLTLLVLLAVPPSGLFFSEYMLAAIGFNQYPLLTAFIFIALTLVCVGMLRHVFSLLFGEMKPESKQEAAPEQWNLTHAVIGIQLIISLVFGIWCLSQSGLLFLADIGSSFITL